MSSFLKFSSLKKDPLFLIGMLVLAGGLVLLVYGFIPQQVPNYSVVATGSVPVTDSSGTFITNPEQYFQAHSSTPGAFDKVVCSVSTGGWSCYGLQFRGMQTIFSESSRYYGIGMIALGGFSMFAGNRLAPFRQKEKHVRPIRIRVDEGICVANGVCVALAPSVFQLRKQSEPTIFAPVAYVVDPQGADNDAIILAAQMCPTGAILIEDAETGERIHPPPPKD